MEGQAAVGREDHAGLDGVRYGLFEVEVEVAVDQHGQVPGQERASGDGHQVDHAASRLGQRGDPAHDRPDELRGNRISADGRPCEAVDNLARQERISVGSVQESPRPLVRYPPEPVHRQGGDVGTGQRGQLDVLGPDAFATAQITEQAAVAAGEQPHDRQADQARDQSAQREQADLIGPMQVINGDEQRPGRRGLLQPGGDPVGKNQWFGDHAGDLFVLVRGGQGGRAGPEQRNDRRARPDLLDLVALGAGDMELQRYGLVADLRKQSGLPDAGRPRHQDRGTRSVLTGTAQHGQRPCHRLATAAQRPRSLHRTRIRRIAPGHEDPGAREVASPKRVRERGLPSDEHEGGTTRTSGKGAPRCLIRPLPQAKVHEEPLLRSSQVLVRQLERGRDGAVFGADSQQLGLGRAINLALLSARSWNESWTG